MEQRIVMALRTADANAVPPILRVLDETEIVVPPLSADNQGCFRPGTSWFWNQQLN
jgi:hypothetical protein